MLAGEICSPKVSVAARPFRLFVRSLGSTVRRVIFGKGAHNGRPFARHKSTVPTYRSVCWRRSKALAGRFEGTDCRGKPRAGGDCHRCRASPWVPADLPPNFHVTASTPSAIPPIQSTNICASGAPSGSIPTSSTGRHLRPPSTRCQTYGSRGDAPRGQNKRQAPIKRAAALRLPLKTIRGRYKKTARRRFL